VESLILEEHGLDAVVRALATEIGATLIVIDVAGAVLASHAVTETVAPEALDAIREEALRHYSSGAPPTHFTPTHPLLGARATVRPLPGGGAEQLGTQWLVAVGEPAGFPDFERFVAQHAVMAVSLALMRERTVHATERRLAGDVLSRALSGTLGAAELGARLAPFGIRADCMVLLMESDDLAAAEARLERTLRTLGINGLVANVPTASRRLLCAVLDPQQRDPLELAATLQAAVSYGGAQVHTAISRTAPREALRRSFHEARCALEVGALGERPAVASAADLGAYRLLLSLQDDEGLRIYCEELLGPIERSRSGNGEELLRSLEVYLEHNGSWEAAARVLLCHRHTLRYRITRIEELTGRNLDLAAHRIEFWLALRGRELLG
jgi:purine catabolism regulator